MQSRPSPQSIGGTLSQTLLRIDPGPPALPEQLVTQSGERFPIASPRRPWTLVYFGFTTCATECPLTLATLGEVARNPGSGVAAGATQIVFVSIDPDRDSPARLKEYLAQFDTSIIGLTGPRAAIMRYARKIGADSRTTATGIDHSTSVFVLNENFRVVGILLRPANPTQIIADLASLRRDSGGIRYFTARD